MNKFIKFKYMKFYNQFNEVTTKKDKFIFSKFDYDDPETDHPKKVLSISEKSRKTAETIYKKISGIDISNEKYRIRPGIIDFTDKTTSENIEINANFETLLENFIVISYLKTC